MSVLRLNDVSKIYGSGENKFYALKNVFVEIKSGEMVAIMGASGSGKSTFLNISGGIDGASEGEVYINDINISSLPDKKKSKIRNENIGFVMQDFALISHYRVYENVMLPLEYKQIRKKNKIKKVDEHLEMLGIKEKRNLYPSELSGGQKQRVAIARALVNDANILLCDEPTGALDKKNTEEIMKIFQKLNEEGKTIVIVTHDINVANCCKRIINIEDGQIQDDKEITGNN